ncbi:MAG: mucoidy inhibitor MuiA family protein [Spirochaetes bacterium]|nr:mucoidy inhibitor MuiA family protein [Spirochaetota bacterium]
MKKEILAALLSTCFLLVFPAMPAVSQENGESSKIVSVKLYQNQAEITRQTKIKLKAGQNKVVLGGLPELLYDWSAKGKLPEGFKGKIQTLEVESKALINKRQKSILEIEEKLEKLRQEDEVFLDDLKNLKSQEEFLNSIMAFSSQNISKELATRIPDVKVWDSTLTYVAAKTKEIFKQRRDIEKKREDLGKEIQKWEFELNQIAGYNYFQNYQTLNKVIITNRSAMNVQQFAEISGKYAEKHQLLEKPTEKIDIEKRFIVDIFSVKACDADFTISYVIPNTYWQMQYDIRASNQDKSIDLVIYGNVYQNTGEDWSDIILSLSTGSPVNAIEPPVLEPWFLDVYTPPAYPQSRTKYDMKKKAEMPEESCQQAAESVQAELEIPETTVTEKGPYFEITIPAAQTILSSNKYQKKYIKGYNLKGNDVTFYYEITPAMKRNGYLKVKTVNTTDLPWISGESQIFLENEFMGKVNIPSIAPGKEEEFVLGIEGRLWAEKELVTKYEDTSGVFGGNRRIMYKYKLKIENQLPQKTEVMVQDMIPVSRNEKIKVELNNLSLPFLKDEKFNKSTEHEQGIRKWKLEIDPKQKKEITYEISISFDKDITINGLK